jgi:transposase
VDRAAQLLSDVLGAPLATGTLAAVVGEGAAGLAGFVEVVRERLAAAPMAHFDETGARVAGRLHWVHSASTSLLSLFTVHAKRGKQAMDAAGVLPDFCGVAVHDGWAPYWRYEHVVHALCGAHLLRELEAITDEPGQGWAAGRQPTHPRGQVPAAACGVRQPATCWPGSTATATRCCGHWTTRACPSTTTRPNATCAW